MIGKKFFIRCREMRGAFAGGNHEHKALSFCRFNADTDKPADPQNYCDDIPAGGSDAKYVVNRNGFAALRLTIGLVQMIHAAADSTTAQRPITGRRTPRRTTSVPAGRATQASLRWPWVRMATLAIRARRRRRANVPFKVETTSIGLPTTTADQHSPSRVHRCRREPVRRACKKCTGWRGPLPDTASRGMVPPRGRASRLPLS
jgi:hypothetical protein